MTMALADIAQVVSAAASAAALVIGAVAAWIAYAQIKANATLARENTALETHRQLLCLCIERPELSSSTLMLKALGRTSFRGILVELTPRSEQALWFVSYVLNGIEQILESNPRDAAWRSTMAAQVDYHRDLLNEVWPAWAEHYGSTLRAFLGEHLEVEQDVPSHS
jgi:hypothetical protein